MFSGAAALAATGATAGDVEARLLCDAQLEEEAAQVGAGGCQARACLPHVLRFAAQCKSLEFSEPRALPEQNLTLLPVPNTPALPCRPTP